MLRQGLMRLEVTNKGKSLMEYNTEIKDELRDKYPIFKRFKKAAQYEEGELRRSYQMQVWLLSVIGPFVLTLILFSCIWWGRAHFWFKLLISEVVFVLSIRGLFRFVPIM